MGVIKCFHGLSDEATEGQRPEGFEQNTAKGRQKDCEARWAVKNKETHYGYQNHVKVDAKSKLIIAFETTPEAISTKGGFDDGFGGVGVCAGVDGAADCFIGIGGLVAQGH